MTTRPAQNTPSYIDGFLFNNKFYEHNNFLHDDDRIELTETGNTQPILVYTSNCYVKDAKGKFIAHTSMRGNVWTIDSYDDKISVSGTNLLEAEIEFSKAYLKMTVE